MAILSSSSHSKVAAIISRPARSEVARTVPELLAWLQAHGYEVIVDPETAKYSNGQEEVSRSQMSSRSLDLVVVLGGDGTLLSAARATAAIDVPLLGVNLGSLGFLTDVPLSSLFSMLDAITKGEAAVEQRSLMQCDLLRGEEVLGSYLVFNDAVVNKTAIARLNNYDLFVDKIFVSSYRADGMIVATPTGSTAYSLSAGGPVLMPTVNAFVITPVAPHSLTHRPLVVPDSTVVELVLRSEEEVAYLSLDGQPGLDLCDGDRVRCRRSEHRVSLFRTDHDFFHVLRTKLKWGEK
ncbi:MAG TPA: NAD(+)/NADH kinase [Candidatus Acidoferrales bacterium]|jgi:NAD+ kinase|nr:NAD(+)/NADH kinase [Candidatus Acidoferrales bacterium]